MPPHADAGDNIVLTSESVQQHLKAGKQNSKKLARRSAPKCLTCQLIEVEVYDQLALMKASLVRSCFIKRKLRVGTRRTGHLANTRGLTLFLLY
jgi:hypothetical protein